MPATPDVADNPAGVAVEVVVAVRKGAGARYTLKRDSPFQEVARLTGNVRPMRLDWWWIPGGTGRGKKEGADVVHRLTPH